MTTKELLPSVDQGGDEVQQVEIDLQEGIQMGCLEYDVIIGQRTSPRERERDRNVLTGESEKKGPDSVGTRKVDRTSISSPGAVRPSGTDRETRTALFSFIPKGAGVFETVSSGPPGPETLSYFLRRYGRDRSLCLLPLLGGRVALGPETWATGRPHYPRPLGQGGD